MHPSSLASALAGGTHNAGTHKDWMLIKPHCTFLIMTRHIMVIKKYRHTKCIINMSAHYVSPLEGSGDILFFSLCLSGRPSVRHKIVSAL